MLFLGEAFCYLVLLLSALSAEELKMKLFQWVQTYSLPLHVQPLVGEEMAVGREVVLFRELCQAAQHGEEMEWLLLAVENVDMLNMVAKDDMYLHT